MLVTFDCPDALIEQIDNITATRKNTASQKTVTPEELRHAKDISKKMGVVAANKYLREVQTPKRHSRSGVLIELLTKALESKN